MTTLVGGEKGGSIIYQRFWVIPMVLGVILIVLRGVAKGVVGVIQMV